MSGKTVKTMSVANYCLPRNLDKTQKENFKQAMIAMSQASFTGRQFLNLYNCSTAIIITSVSGILLCLAYIFTMSKCAEKMAWAVIFMIGAGLLAATVLSIMGVVKPDSLGLASYAPTSTFVVVAIVSSLCSLIFFLMLCLGYR